MDNNHYDTEGKSVEEIVDDVLDIIYHNEEKYDSSITMGILGFGCHEVNRDVMKKGIVHELRTGKNVLKEYAEIRCLSKNASEDAISEQRRKELIEKDCNADGFWHLSDFFTDYEIDEMIERYG